MSLDPNATALEEFKAGAQKREAKIYSMNHLEPPFPWKVVPFPSIFFAGIADPDNPRVPLI